LLLNWTYRYRNGRIGSHIVILLLLLLLLLLLIKYVCLRLENQTIWGLVLPLLSELVLIPIIPSHVVLIIHHLVLKLLLLLILQILLLHVPLLLLLLMLLPKWVVVYVLKRAKCDGIIVLVYSEVLELVMRALALALLGIFLLKTLENLWLVLELRSNSVNLLVFEPLLLRILNLDSSMHRFIRIHHH